MWKYSIMWLLIGVVVYLIVMYFWFEWGGLPEAKPVPRVYQINDCDWWAGYDLESTKAAYVKETGVPPKGAFYNPRELTDEEMDTMLHFGDEGSYRTSITFRQELDHMIESGFEFPWFFASTEY